MKILIFTLLFFSISVAQKNKLNLMPYPKSIEVTSDKFRFDENFTLQFSDVSSRLEKLSNRFLMRLAKRTGEFWAQPFASVVKENSNSSMRIDVNRNGEIKLNEDESYELIIKSTSIIIKSKTDIGA